MNQFMQIKSIRLLLFLFITVSCGEATSTSENESQTKAIGNKKISKEKVGYYLLQAGFPESVIPRMVCTALYESAWATDSTNRNTNGSSDTGLFQINSIHLGNRGMCHGIVRGKGGPQAMFDPTLNTKCALRVYRAQGINAWYGYKKHMKTCNNYHNKYPQLVSKAKALAGKTTTPTASSPAKKSTSPSLSQWVASSQCNLQGLNLCQTNGGGEQCYEDNKCVAPQGRTTSTCNKVQLDICIAHKGGTACYVKWSCPSN